MATSFSSRAPVRQAAYQDPAATMRVEQASAGRDRGMQTYVSDYQTGLAQAATVVYKVVLTKPGTISVAPSVSGGSINVSFEDGGTEGGTYAAITAQSPVAAALLPAAYTPGATFSSGGTLTGTPTVREIATIGSNANAFPPNMALIPRTVQAGTYYVRVLARAASTAYTIRVMVDELV